jgi:N-acetylmuramoyl-L-alanine amidase
LAVAAAGVAVVSLGVPVLTATARAQEASGAFDWFSKATAAGNSAGASAAQDKEATPEFVSQATAVDVIGDQDETLFQLTLTRGVTAEVYTLANPYRVIIDLPDVGFALSPEAGRDARGLVSSFRYGQFDKGKARIVLDTTGPVAIARARMENVRSGSGVVLTVALKPTEAIAFGEGTGGGRQPRAASNESTPTRPTRDASARPIVVIDAGHGGIDPGAVGAANLLEKNLVLSVAKKVQEQLETSGRFEVVMTRSGDVFVSLNDRLAVSKKAQADLFISIHADSIEETYAQSIKGATIYTLSERASDAEARAIAEKENASDLIAGLDAGDGEDNTDVKNILIDLMKRETANFSAEFSRTLVRSLKTNIRLSRDPQRSAAFKVLRQTHAPSVLVELGYVSNPEESRQMQSASWQVKVADSIVAAIESFFAKR